MHTLRSLNFIGAIGLWLIALWLVSVTMLVLPHGNTNQIPFWVVVATCMAGFASISLWFLHRPAVWTRWVLLIGSLAATAFGIFMIISNELHARRTGDFEGYLLLMGLALVGTGLCNFFYAWRQKTITARS